MERDEDQRIVTTSDTGITLNRSSGDSTQAYAFYPTFYTAEDGTIKVTHAADVLGSNIGRSFWAGLYGRKSDPALNLPSRFTPAYRGTSLIGWQANYLSSRKKLRGFSLRKAEPNPATNAYDLLGTTPLAGSTVRVEANVHNYSTAVGANDLKVRFDVINYDSHSDAEIKFTSCPAGNSAAEDGPLHHRRDHRRPAQPAPDGARRDHLGHNRLRPGAAGRLI